MKYLVKSPIQMDGKFHGPGRKIELEPDQAAAMPWAVEAIPEAPKTRPEDNKKREP